MDVLRLVVWLLLLAAVLYAVFWSIDRRAGDADERASLRRTLSDRLPRRTPPSGPRGPDDDEDFLRELDRRRREER